MEDQPKIINDIQDKEKYSQTYPQITDTDNGGALHELHIFLLPLNPDNATVDKAIALIKKFNQEQKLEYYTMKMCYLTLVFRNLGPVKILQSARYYRSNDMNDVIKAAYTDANFFVENGFNVVRVKIEANAISNTGIPQTDEEAKLYPKYFEFHIKVAPKTASTVELITQEESEQLLAVSEEIKDLYKTPVPVSWNNVANCDNPDNPGYQRFLNIRFREMGMLNITERLNNLKDSINQKTSFNVVKSIEEYVWYDTYTEMDHGWIDFTPEEMAN